MEFGGAFIAQAEKEKWILFLYKIIYSRTKYFFKFYHPLWKKLKYKMRFRVDIRTRDFPVGETFLQQLNEIRMKSITVFRLDVKYSICFNFN